MALAAKLPTSEIGTSPQTNTAIVIVSPCNVPIVFMLTFRTGFGLLVSSRLRRSWRSFGRPCSYRIGTRRPSSGNDSRFWCLETKRMLLPCDCGAGCGSYQLNILLTGGSWRTTILRFPLPKIESLQKGPRACEFRCRIWYSPHVPMLGFHHLFQGHTWGTCAATVALHALLWFFSSALSLFHCRVPGLQKGRRRVRKVLSPEIGSGNVFCPPAIPYTF